MSSLSRVREMACTVEKYTLIALDLSLEASVE